MAETEKENAKEDPTLKKTKETEGNSPSEDVNDQHNVRLFICLSHSSVVRFQDGSCLETYKLFPLTGTNVICDRSEMLSVIT